MRITSALPPSTPSKCTRMEFTQEAMAHDYPEEGGLLAVSRGAGWYRIQRALHSALKASSVEIGIKKGPSSLQGVL